MTTSATLVHESSAKLKENRVAQPIRARLNMDDAAALPRHVIDARLDDLISSANEIRLLRANPNGEVLFPVRLDGVTKKWRTDLRSKGVRRHAQTRHQVR